ncbi:hypothetical protein KQX62_06235 [Rhodopseudomonas palustris]|uniref:Uncharacterized protein n=1 Tax=Rhodopseudomonas palustris TaxID=1076 RepID=A0AAX3E251_RHOPL|nr:hypothetical protein [Rhodopseudomonas palustris]UYO40900.1 hypothetical protein KQX62_06235 [Rhodopseudomonas palustris]
MLTAAGALFVVLVAGAKWGATQLSDAALPEPQKFDPQKAFDDGIALEKLWQAAKSNKKAFPPGPAYVDKVDRAIGEIPLDWPMAKEAEALVLRLRVERPAIEKAYQAAEKHRAEQATLAREKNLLEKRRNAAKVMETTFLDGGSDVYVSAEGKEFRTLRIRYILMSRPLVYKIQKNDVMLNNWRDLGFREVILTDGYNSVWTMKL